MRKGRKFQFLDTGLGKRDEGLTVNSILGGTCSQRLWKSKSELSLVVKVHA